MLKLLIKKFIENHDDYSNMKVREKYCLISGVIGIISNILLFAIKFIIGSITNSIAIISDAFNNLSDIGTSCVTIVGSKLSGKKPDKEHPFGHGRVEYVSTLFISFLIMLVGFELIQTSYDKIINPSESILSIPLTIILIASILVKIYLFFANRYMGKCINSSVLNATAFDCLNDVISTSAVIISTIIGHFINIPIDGIMGMIVSVMIILTGYGVAKDTITSLLGSPPDEEVVKSIKDIIINSDGILGVHDLIVHDYGPGRTMASVHAEVPVDINIITIHETIDALEKKIQDELNIHIVIHMDPILSNCERTNEIKSIVKEILGEFDIEIGIHDFRITDGENNINLIFDIELPIATDDKKQAEIIDTINQKLKEKDKRYNTVINVDYII